MNLFDRILSEPGEWTLFLDRDGVINQEFGSSYVCRTDDFHFAEGALKAIRTLSPIFKHIIVVTNQRGVGIGEMSEEDLLIIHRNMLSEIFRAGGRVDHIFFCPDAHRDSKARKPHGAMALKAKEKYPKIDFQKSLIAGNTEGDMDFGKKLGMTTVFIDDKKRGPAFRKENMDYFHENLFSFSESFRRT